MSEFLRIKADLKRALDSKVEAATGNVPEPAYRFLCGEIAALRKAISVISEYERKYSEDEDIETL